MGLAPWSWVAAGAAGALAGALAFLALVTMPERWLRDAVPGPEPESPLPDPRIRFLPFGLLWILASGALGVRALAALGPGAALVVGLVALVPLGVLFAADCLTRILPDQAVVGLAALGVLCFFLDLVPSLSGTLPGSLPAGSPWWLGALDRLGAGAAGGGLLLLVGWIGAKAAKREAMGMGDVKLLAAAGLVTGLAGLVGVLLVGFVTGAVLAVPQLVRKYAGRRRKDAAADAAPDGAPDDASDDAPEPDGTMPFGPFLVLGVVAVLFFGDALRSVAAWYLSMF